MPSSYNINFTSTAAGLVTENASSIHFQRNTANQILTAEMTALSTGSAGDNRDGQFRHDNVPFHFRPTSSSHSLFLPHSAIESLKIAVTDRTCGFCGDLPLDDQGSHLQRRCSYDRRQSPLALHIQDTPLVSSERLSYVSFS